MFNRSRWANNSTTTPLFYIYCCSALNAMGKRINEMPIVEIRESTFELEDMLQRLSSINTNHTNISNNFTEALLCLGNEIKKIKAFLVLD